MEQSEPRPQATKLRRRLWALIASGLVSGPVLLVVLLQLLRHHADKSMMRTQMISMANYIDVYRSDQGVPPMITMTYAESALRSWRPDTPPERMWRTFRCYGGGQKEVVGLWALNMGLWVDFDWFWRPRPGRPLGYYTDGKDYIIVSMGPDMDFDLMLDEGDLDASSRNDVIEQVFDARIPQPSVTLLTSAGPRGAYTYDPTNGYFSSGDIWQLSRQ